MGNKRKLVKGFLGKLINPDHIVALENSGVSVHIHLANKDQLSYAFGTYEEAEKEFNRICKEFEEG